MSSNDEISESIKVFIRERPFTEDELRLESASVASHSRDGCVRYKGSEFQFEAFFDSSSTQEDLYETAARPIVETCLKGYSGTIFAYGSTGSGKTYTMLGSEDTSRRGILPRCVEQILSETHGAAEITVSYLQIYCEMVGDLLSPSNGTLTIRERSGEVFVEGLSKTKIVSLEDVATLLALGDRNRATASTLMNATSSRSHAAFILSIGFPGAVGHENRKGSSLVLVDLAGSERYSASAGNYARMEEARAINLSLSALGNCMSALAESRAHVPYRDSKLTRLLQGSLGGGSRTAVIVNIAPGADENGDVLNSLKFASRAAKVKVVAKVARYIDYEALYYGAQKELDIRDKQQSELLIQLSQRASQLEDNSIEIESLKEELRKLSSLQTISSSESGLQTCKGCLKNRGSVETNVVAETVVKELEVKHAQEMETLCQQNEKKVRYFIFFYRLFEFI
jgi:kinesin family member 5